MRRIRELIDEVRSTYPNDPFFDWFFETCRENPSKRKAYRSYEDALKWLDPDSWRVIKRKAVEHFRDHRGGQQKQGFFNQLNDALAYRHLVRQGCRRVRVLPEGRERTPDLAYVVGRQQRHCEVKTIGISDLEISRRQSRQAYKNAYTTLGDGFIAKLRNTIAGARAQIAAAGGDGLVYVIVNLDDIAQDYYRDYRRELAAFARSEKVDDVFLRIGVRFNRRMRLTSGRSRRSVAF